MNNDALNNLEDPQVLWVRSLLSSRTRQGLVSIELNARQLAQLNLDEARDFQRNLAAAIEAAQSDEFLFQFLTQRLGLKDAQAGAALMDFREMRGHLTRVKKRVACGVCPCCNRSFEDLRRHMQTKHPEYAEAGEQS